MIYQSFYIRTNFYPTTIAVTYEQEKKSSTTIGIFYFTVFPANGTGEY